jgi:murein DD-endopeptidase MepM/ murein hydrolase activator NlpD
LANNSFTVIVVPDDNAQVRRYRVRKNLLKQVAAAAGVLAALITGGTIHYLTVARDAAENHYLREENLALHGQLKAVRERIDHIGTTLDRVERFDQKLRALTLLPDPQRGLAVGPTEEKPGARMASRGEEENPFATVGRSENPLVASSRLDRLTAEATRQEQSLQDLQTYFQNQKVRLASTPSVWPTRGWVTSDFGNRLDPYTADRVMHHGLDIAAPYGKDVLSPSDGIVVFSGLEGGYGNVLVIDHGYGVKTRYGHLAQIDVKAGERVSRGQKLGSVGNTGRSTGPHLHYEVRVNGVPENPRKFILED